MDPIAFFNLPAYGHIRPTLPVVECLVRRGCRVLYFIDESHRDVVAATGADVRVVPNYTGAPEVLPDTMTGYAAGLAEQTFRTLPLLLEAVQAERVGLLVHDSICPWGRYLAQLTGLPSVRTCGVLMGFDRTLPRGRRVVPWWWAMTQFRFSEWRTFRRYRRDLIRTFGLRDVRIGQILGARPSADRTLVFTSSEFIPHAERLDERTLFVGASFSEPDPGDFPVPGPDARPLIYISLGTTFTDEAAFFRSCKEAFTGVDAWVVISLGRKVKQEELEPWPENFRVGAYVPQLAILRRASVFVTQAGGCSVMEGLWHGVPLVMWPLTFEHRYNAQRVEDLGAGVILTPEDLTGERLREVSMAVQSDSQYRAAARRLGDSFRAAGGPEKAADWILRFNSGAETR